ncbi:sensor histidine kinase [Edaphobacter albus]|uniref:sensor histidine kinase n=1 Tax=Edaphobacter sp. 4G125 TaxID=2763071 RepID=UPI0016493F2D|nr:ATP-binding protein [Edaphobacter sp. 4G125]QNI38150.1 PAS domain-containing protein [Edaphobacter sp. 4G125]
MRLKTKLVVSATGLTFAIVAVLSILFVGELLRQRIEQTAAANDVLASQVTLMTRQAIETGLRANPPSDLSDEALSAAVTDALRNYQPLTDVMNAIIRYSPTVQDVSVTDAQGITIVSTDPGEVGQSLEHRNSLGSIQNGSIAYQRKQVFGRPQVFDTMQPLDRNGKPFLVIHVGVRSTFLRNSYEPWLRAAGLFALLAALAAMLASAVLANAALQPIEQISRQLEKLTSQSGEAAAGSNQDGSDTVVRVSQTISRLGEQMRSQEAGYTALQANLNQMLDALRDGVLLFNADGRAMMVSDAVAYFLNQPQDDLIGERVEEIFAPGTALGSAVHSAFAEGESVSAESVTLEDGRQVQLSIDRFDDGLGGGSLGTLVTLRDLESVLQLGQELEISRRLAAIGRLTAGVGHEVKNPINAMVVHLELLRSKLAIAGPDAFGGAQRHVDILAGEMQRLDRVVQTLADFSRPMEMKLRDHDMRQVVNAVIELTAAEMHENGIQVEVDAPAKPLMVRIDSELVRQALLNLFLNGMQAMAQGGRLRIRLYRDHLFAVVEVMDEGTGIPAEILPRIFELYFTTKTRGSGIGLAMTYRILQMHGGALDVRSNADPQAQDRGTTFTVRLPIAVVETRKAVAAEASRRVIGEHV